MVVGYYKSTTQHKTRQGPTSGEVGSHTHPLFRVLFVFEFEFPSFAMLAVTSTNDKENSLYASNAKTFGRNSNPIQSKAIPRKALGDSTNTPARKAFSDITNKQPTPHAGPQKTVQKECTNSTITLHIILPLLSFLLF